MKILQICSASEIGGGEVHVADLVRALASRGHAVYLAVRPDSPLRQPLAGVIASWHEMPLRNSLDVQSSRALADLIKRNNIQLIHAHVGRDYMVAAMAARRARSAKLVLTRHHYLPLQRNRLYRWMLDNVAAFIAVSESVRESLIETLSLEPERVHIIPNWIDPLRFHPIDRDAARAMFQIEGNLTVACIGQLTPEKGQEEFIRAAGYVVRRRSGVEFLVAGEEKEEGEPFTRHLKLIAEQIGILDRVRFLGFIHHVPELLAATDIVVVPSWDEGFSLVTIEAMAARKPVLAAKVGGLAGLIQENVNGWFFPARDAKTLGDRLSWLLSDSALRERLAAQGQQDVYNHYSRDKVIDRIEALYRTLVDDNTEDKIVSVRS